MNRSSVESGVQHFMQRWNGLHVFCDEPPKLVLRCDYLYRVALEVLSLAPDCYDFVDRLRASSLRGNLQMLESETTGSVQRHYMNLMFSHVLSSTSMSVDAARPSASYVPFSCVLFSIWRSV